MLTIASSGKKAEKRLLTGARFAGQREKGSAARRRFARRFHRLWKASQQFDTRSTSCPWPMAKRSNMTARLAAIACNHPLHRQCSWEYRLGMRTPPCPRTAPREPVRANVPLPESLVHAHPAGGCRLLLFPLRAMRPTTPMTPI